MAGVAFLLSNLREAGAPIKRIENQSSGVIPVMKMLEDAFSYANQLGARQGAGAVYLHAHHPDILRFLDTKTGKCRRKNPYQNTFTRRGDPGHHLPAGESKRADGALFAL
ncbi:ribonucleoside-diphosphate reductase 2 subunit alpha [Salmonella bongori]|nr:ribonucleoside-diphosphate reductase 2 subunit alpha [Salmonella bongori]